MSALTELFLARNSRYLPAESLAFLQARLEELTPRQQEYVFSVKLKDPVLAWVFSFFFGHLAVDRFYLGQFGLALAKLFLWWASLGLWIVVDWFLIVKSTKEKNLERLHQQLLEAYYMP
ncbi:TPA: TM2 domain-containing protein [Streptococcus suis]